MYFKHLTFAFNEPNSVVFLVAHVLLNFLNLIFCHMRPEGAGLEAISNYFKAPFGVTFVVFDVQIPKLVSLARF